CARLLLCSSSTATTACYTLSLHDALPICWKSCLVCHSRSASQAAVQAAVQTLASPATALVAAKAASIAAALAAAHAAPPVAALRSEEHTSELQSRENLVCRLLLEKKKHAQ